MSANFGPTSTDAEGKEKSSRALLRAICSRAEQALAANGSESVCFWLHELELPPVERTSEQNLIEVAISVCAEVSAEIADRWQSFLRSYADLRTDRELVLGVGFRSDNSADFGDSGPRHLLTIPVVIERSPAGDIFLRPNGNAVVESVFANGVTEIEVPGDLTLLDPQIFGEWLRKFLPATSLHAEFSPAAEPQMPLAAGSIHWAPALILRPKWAAPCLRWARQQLNLPAPDQQPASVWSHILAGKNLNSSATQPPPAQSVDALPFPPLPEERPCYLSTSPITHVQGGGQDWLLGAINLLCQHLQQQQRVLVAASNRALLQAVTTKLGPALKSFQAALESADSQSANLPGRLTEELANLQQLLAKNEAALVSQVQSEAQEIEVAGLRGTPLKIGRHIEQHQARDGWLGDAIGEAEKLPLTPAELEELRSWWASTNSQADPYVESAGAMEQLRKLPRASLVRDIIKAWQQERKSSDAVKTQQSQQGAYAAVAASQISADQLAPVILPIRQAAAAMRNLPQKKEGWTQQAIADTMAGKDDWRSRKGKLDRSLPIIPPILTAVAGRSIDVKTADEKSLRAELLLIIQHLEKGGSLTWLRSLVNWQVAKWRKQLSNVRIDNKPCYRAAELKLILSWLELKQYLNLVWQGWQGLAEPASLAIPDQQAKLFELQKKLGSLLLVLEPFTIAANLVRGLNVKNLELPISTNPDDLENFASSLEAYVAQARQAPIKHPFAEPVKILGQFAKKFPESKLLRQVVSALDQCQADAYEQLLKQVALQDQQRARNERAQQLATRLAAKMPSFAHQLQATAADEIWKKRLPAIQAAWAWSQAYRSLRKSSAGRNPQALHRRHFELARSLELVRIQLAAAQASITTESADVPAGCESLIPGCCWTADPGSLSIKTDNNEASFDVILLLTEGDALPPEIRLLTQARRLIVVERTGATRSSPDALLSWQGVLAPCGAELHKFAKFDPTTLLTMPLLSDGQERTSDDSVFRQGVAEALQEVGYTVSQTLPNEEQHWRPTFVMPDRTAPFVLQCYGSAPQSTAALRSSFHDQLRWQRAGWQVRHLYASDYYVHGKNAVRDLIPAAAVDAGSDAPASRSKARNGKSAGPGKNARPNGHSSNVHANGRWRKFMQMGAELQFNERDELVAVDFRHTRPSLRDFAELADVLTLHTLYLPIATQDETLKKLTWLQRLTCLDLSYSPITNRGLAALEPLAQLRILSLCNTQISDDGIDSLARLRALEQLDLRMTRITEAGRAQLGQALSSCQILFTPIGKPERTAHGSATS